MSLFGRKKKVQKPIMTATKTLAFQIPEELDMRIKKYLASEKERTGKKVSQREFTPMSISLPAPRCRERDI